MLNSNLHSKGACWFLGSDLEGKEINFNKTRQEVIFDPMKMIKPVVSTVYIFYLLGADTDMFSAAYNVTLKAGKT